MSAPSLFAEQELIDSVHAARNAATPLSIIGSGTKSQIGRPAQSDKTLSTAALTGVTLHEPAEMVIAARSGTPLAEVERRLADKKQMNVQHVVLITLICLLLSSKWWQRVCRSHSKVQSNNVLNWFRNHFFLLITLWLVSI